VNYIETHYPAVKDMLQPSVTKSEEGVVSQLHARTEPKVKITTKPKSYKYVETRSMKKSKRNKHYIITLKLS
jgi:hypothetical protein